MTLEILATSNFVVEKPQPIPIPTVSPRVQKMLDIFSLNGNRATRDDLLSAFCPDGQDPRKANKVLASTVSETRKQLRPENRTIVFLDSNNEYVIEDDIVLPNGERVHLVGEKQREAARLFSQPNTVVTFRELYPDEADISKGNRNIKGVVAKIRKPFQNANYNISSSTNMEGVTQYVNRLGNPKTEAKLKNGKEIESKSSKQNQITEFLSVTGEAIPTEALIELFFDPNDMQRSRKKLRLMMRDIQKRARAKEAVLRIIPRGKGLYLYELLVPQSTTTHELIVDTYESLPYIPLTPDEKKYFGFRLIDLRSAMDPDNPDPTIVSEIKKVEEQLVHGHVKLIPWTRNRYNIRSKFTSNDDLYQAGLMGLHTAIRKFDPTKGTLTTYAVPWIRLHMQRHIQNFGNSGLKVSEEDSRTLNKARFLQNTLTLEEGREVTLREAASKMGLNTHQIDRLSSTLEAKTRVASLDLNSNNTRFSIDSDTIFKKYTEEGSISEQEKRAVDNSLRHAIEALFDDLSNSGKYGNGALTDGENTAIQLKFGIRGEPNATLQDIANQLGCSISTVKILIRSGFGKIRNSPHADGLRDYLLT